MSPLQYVKPDDLINWDDLKNYLGSSKSPFKYFRGQRKASWSLEPSLKRHHPDVFNSNELFIQYYKDAANQMIAANIINEDELKSIRIWGKPKGISTSDIEAEELRARHICIWKMRHFGVATHYLDVTKSFYIACFFALFDEMNEFQKNLENDSNKDEWPCVYAFPHDLIPFSEENQVRVSPYINDRVSIQQAVAVDTQIRPYHNFVKYFINPSELKKIYRDLRQMNINGYVLYRTPEKAALDLYNFKKYWE